MVLYISVAVYVVGGILFAHSAYRMHRAEKGFNRAEAIYRRLTHKREAG